MSSVKIFPKSRVCVINAFPSFVDGLQQALKFAQSHSITLNSLDGRKIIFGFCLKAIDSLFKNTQSSFPKVLCLSVDTNNQRISSFIDNHFDTIISRLPFPYCGKINFNSPDLEYAAEASLKKQKTQRSFQKLANALDLRGI